MVGLSRRREILEMLGQCEPLALIGGADGAPVELVRAGDQALVDEAAQNLAVLDQKRHLVRAHLENGAAAGPAALRGAKARIKEAGEMDAELADEGVVREHFG